MAKTAQPGGSDRKTVYFLSNHPEKVEPAPDWRPTKYLRQNGEVANVEPATAPPPKHRKNGR